MFPMMLLHFRDILDTAIYFTPKAAQTGPQKKAETGRKMAVTRATRRIGKKVNHGLVVYSKASIFGL